MTPPTTSRDPWLEVPLTGVQLVQASAGTGKTFTLATLVTRLVVEQGLRIAQILAVTYTEAATQELRKRIRERLQLALSLCGADANADDSPEAQLTREMLQQHLDAQAQLPPEDRETAEQLQQRLHQAVLDTDLAAIFTIHGFCARVLREHALESGRGFDVPDLLTDERSLLESLAADLWRSHAGDAAGVDDLLALWGGGPEVMAKDLSALLREPVLRPEAMELSVEPMPALRQARAALAEAFRAHGEALRQALLAALDAKVLNGGSYKAAWIDALFDQAAKWCEGDVEATRFPDDKLEYLTRDKLQQRTNKGKAGATPDSPLCDAAQDYLDADAELEAWREARRIALLHRIREDGRARIALLKRQRHVQTYDDMIDGVADALNDAAADALAKALRQQYAVALVDEFQDTDARQWSIFDRVFGSASGAPALFLIGDAKQAIYGFRGGDVHAYLAAADTAARAPELSHNFRSRPRVLRAIEALYRNAQTAFEGDAKTFKTAPFVDERIKFHAVEPGGKRADDDMQQQGAPSPGLTIWNAPLAPPTEKGAPGAWSAEASRDHATAGCVAAIHARLSHQDDSGTWLRDRHDQLLRPVAPGDIAVLVRTHHEAMRIQQALSLVGIPAVAAGKLSLFETDEARELHMLLLALLHAGDDGRLRTAMATVLLGADALQIAALDHDATLHRNWQQRANSWRERLRQGGPLALVSDLASTEAARLLTLFDGERRLSNLLQLAEVLQEAQHTTSGLQALVDWLGQRIASADRDDDTQLLRLESDARRVQIVTLHKSKGLEYPLVFLPFVGIGRQARAPERNCIVPSQEGRFLQWKTREEAWKEASEAWKLEQKAEAARLLYVALTRAEHALWIASGAFYGAHATPLFAMLQDKDALRAAGVVFDDTEPRADLPRLTLDATTAVPPARAVTRVLRSDWWVHSFSQLAKADAGASHAAASTLPAEGGNDEPADDVEALPATTLDTRFTGNRFGVALHAALEVADFSAWRKWRPGDAAPAGQQASIADALRAEGYPSEQIDDGVALTTELIGQTLTVALPEGTRLCDVPEVQRRPEIEFQFALQPVQIDALITMLHRYDIVRDRHAFGLRRQLEGLMTGLIDLVYQHEGRWYVLDYKSNRLPTYDEAALQRAMQHSEYDLQALIYTVALHRWLRFRLGAAYDYARDFGGIRYLFCRGLDATRAESPGIHAECFKPELVEALDTLFGSTPPTGGAS